jgi:ubiquinone/menaquinone biosynthesis C-methylase UbiE
VLGWIKGTGGGLTGKWALNIGSGNDEDFICQHEEQKPQTIPCDMVLRSLRLLQDANPSRHLVCADACHLPFRANVFDVILYIVSLHLMNPIERPASEACRVLASGGGLYIYEWNADCLVWLPGRILPKSVRSLERRIFRYLLRSKKRNIVASPYERLLTRTEVTQTLAAIGLRVEKTEILERTTSALPRSIRWLWEKAAAVWPLLIESRGHSYIYHATKP